MRRSLSQETYLVFRKFSIIFQDLKELSLSIVCHYYHLKGEGEGIDGSVFMHSEVGKSLWPFFLGRDDPKPECTSLSVSKLSSICTMLGCRRPRMISISRCRFLSSFSERPNFGINFRATTCQWLDEESRPNHTKHQHQSSRTETLDWASLIITVCLPFHFPHSTLALPKLPLLLP